MVNLILFGLLAIVLGVGLAILFNKLVIKNFPKTSRIMGYVKTVIVFLLIAVVLFAAISGKIIVDSVVKSFSGEFKETIIKNNSNLDFVKRGLNLTGINNDISKLNSVANDLNTLLWPKASQIGVPKFVFNIGVNSIMKELQKRLAVVDAAGNAKNPFVDEKNFMTVSSLINGVQVTILKIVKITVLVIVVICLILLGIYILVSLSTASKEKKRNEGNTTD